MKIAIACDHAGYEYKERLVKYLREKGHEVKGFRCLFCREYGLSGYSSSDGCGRGGW